MTGAGATRGAGAHELSDDLWEREVVRSAEPVLVDFWAPWCAPCRKIRPMVEDLGARHAGRLRVAALDVDAHPRTASRYDVLSLPTLILFAGGEPVARLSGGIRADRLEAAVLPHLPAAA
jgi:thioredoxin 1